MTIRCYRSAAGNNKISDWYEGLSVEEKSDADEFLKNMCGMKEWKFPHYAPLRNMDGIGELRWISGKKQQRLLGFLSGGVFYALIGCTHKQRVYSPPDALETARRRKREIEREGVDTVEYDL